MKLLESRERTLEGCEQFLELHWAVQLGPSVREGKIE
jgi:hypothetical protein